MFKQITQEPLVHFLFAGFLLFLYFDACTTTKGTDDTILVNKETLLDFMQFQSKAFNKTVFEEKFAQFSDKEKEKILEDYIKEEALYREAIKLGLNENDFVIKRRIVQKMEFLLDDFDESTVEILEDSLENYYQQHKHRYFQPEQYTFTHLFFKKSADQKGLEKANNFMKSAKHQQLTATASLPYGDRFLYHRNYAEKEVNFLESQFGNSFIKAIAELEADPSIWQGPIPSDYGWHWIKLIDKSVATYSKLTDIRATVKGDYLNYLKQKQQQQHIQELVEEYKVVIDL